MREGGDTRQVSLVLCDGECPLRTLSGRELRQWLADAEALERHFRDGGHVRLWIDESDLVFHSPDGLARSLGELVQLLVGYIEGLPALDEAAEDQLARRG